MKEAIGGVLSLNIILIFLVIISCYLAFSVNYTKAFRVKNEIRSIIEKNEGLTCDALDQINTLMQKTNYQQPNFCPDDSWTLVTKEVTPKLSMGGFCFKVIPVDKYGTYKPGEKYKGAYYEIATYVNVLQFGQFGGTAKQINSLWAILSQPFVVKGETALIYSSGVDYEGIPSNCVTAN